MVRDPFTYLLELRRRYVRDWYWLAAGVIAIGFGITVSSGPSHPPGMAAGAGVMLVGLVAGYLGYRRGLPLSGSRHGDSSARHRPATGPVDPEG